MSRPPTMSQLLKRAGLSKRSRMGRSTGPGSVDPDSLSKQKHSKRNSTRKSVNNTNKNRNTKRQDKDDKDDNDGDDDGDDNYKNNNTEKETTKDADAGGGSVRSAAVDDRIEALERELEGNGNSSNSSNDESSSSEGSEDEDDGSGGEDSRSTDDRQRRELKLSSALQAEKIEPLPAHLLPRPGCGITKASKSTKKPKKRPRDGGEAIAAQGPEQSRGLESAVKELMANYEARSSERVPFYCRVCKFQGESLEALQTHKQEPLHKEATKKERKVSTCSLCKKQFTSPPQLQERWVEAQVVKVSNSYREQKKEHLAGKAHIEKVQTTMARQGKWVLGGETSSQANVYSNGRRGGWGGRGGPGRESYSRGRGRGNGGRRGRGRG